jgi:hypothetical protein
MEVKVPSMEVPIKDLKVLPSYVTDSYVKRIKQVCNKAGLSPRMLRKWLGARKYITRFQGQMDANSQWMVANL